MADHVGYSVNGVRRELNADLEQLREFAIALKNEQEIDVDELINHVNSMICKSNGFNCVSVEGLAGFDNLTHIELPLIDTEE